MLLEIGDWLAANGEAIYGTDPWKVYGEGPTRITPGTFNDVARPPFTRDDIRFTTARGDLYAAVLGGESGDAVTIRSARLHVAARRHGRPRATPRRRHRPRMDPGRRRPCRRPSRRLRTPTRPPHPIRPTRRRNDPHTAARARALDASGRVVERLLLPASSPLNCATCSRHSSRSMRFTFSHGSSAMLNS